MLLTLVLAAACSTTRTTATDDVCLIWGAQSYSAQADTAETVAEIRKRNAVRDAYCKARK